MAKVLNRDLRITGKGAFYVNEIMIVNGDGEIVAPTSEITDLTTTGNTVLGNNTADTLVVTATSTFNGTVTVGVNGTGKDVKFFGDTSGKSWLWDESADKMIVTGATDLLGNTQQTGTLTVGVDDTGYDVTFFGATTGKSRLWDESADKMIVTGTSTFGDDVTIASAKMIVGAGTGANGIVLKNLKNQAAGSLSGTQLTVEIDIGGTPYYFLVSPTLS